MFSLPLDLFVRRERFRAEINLIFKKNSQIISKVEFKWGMICADIFGIVLGKLSYCEQLYPIIIFPINKYSEVQLYSAILSLNLAIYLKKKAVDCFFLMPRK